MIGGNYLKRDNFITLFDAHLHITSNSVIVPGFNSVFIYREIQKKKSDSHFGSVLPFHTGIGAVFYDLTEISVKYIDIIELFRTYTFLKVPMNIKMKRKQYK